MSAPFFVPVAFSEEEALHLLGAARAIVQSAPPGSMKELRPLAAAMMRLAEASDKARAKAEAEAA